MEIEKEVDGSKQLLQMVTTDICMLVKRVFVLAVAAEILHFAAVVEVSVVDVAVAVVLVLQAVAVLAASAAARPAAGTVTASAAAVALVAAVAPTAAAAAASAEATSAELQLRSLKAEVYEHQQGDFLVHFELHEEI